ncbi:flavodoxin [Nocardia wallacei]|uniref:flavodoxin n=1 Tax=Nocardia wallacei TaxID=480035 RepID=UPI002454FF74|nr:flavodoxin [Nocardia wallacei]
MIMSTFVHAVDLTGKTVLPFVTYAVSGMGTVEDDYRNMLPHSDIRSGLAVRGETTADAGPDVDRWLRATGLTR